MGLKDIFSAFSGGQTKILKYPVGDMQANCYLIVDQKTKCAAVVDPGADAEQILHAVKENGLIVECILLTHAHFDHVMALPEVAEKTGAPLYLHAADAEILADNKKSCMPEDIALSMPSPAKLLEEGDEIKVGSKTVLVLHTPGHTPGSVCYLVDKYLITGDTLFRSACGRWDLYGGNRETLFASLKRLCGLGANYKIYPGHGASSSLFQEIMNNPCLQHLH